MFARGKFKICKDFGIGQKRFRFRYVLFVQVK